MSKSKPRLILIDVACSEILSESEQAFIILQALEEQGLPPHKGVEIVDISPQLRVHFLEHSSHHNIEVAVLFGVVR